MARYFSRRGDGWLNGPFDSYGDAMGEHTAWLEAYSKPHDRWPPPSIMLDLLSLQLDELEGLLLSDPVLRAVFDSGRVRGWSDAVGRG